jgi:WD40 repeat protein
LEAKYGAGHVWVDVLDRIRPLVKSEALSVRPDRVVWNDPLPGATKALFVRYALNGQAGHASVLHHEVLSIGEQVKPENAPAKAAVPSPKSRLLGDLANDKDPAEKGKLTATEHFTLKDQHKDAITRIAFHPSLAVLASGSKDGQVLLWDLKNRAFQNQVHKFTNRDREVWALGFHPDGNPIAFANRDWWGSKLHFKTAAGPGVEVKDFKHGGGAVASIAYSADGQLFAAGQDDGTIRLWGVDPPRELSAIALGTGHNVYSLAFGPIAVDRKRKSRGYLLAAGGEDGMVRTYTATFSRANGGQAGFQLTNAQFAQAGAVIGLRFSPNGEILGCTRRGGDISLCNPHTGAHIRTLAGGRGGGDPVQWIAFHPQKPWCITAHQNAQVARLWNTDSGELLCELKGHTAGVMCAEFSPDGQFAATASEDLSIKLWKLVDPAAPAPKQRPKRR